MRIYSRFLIAAAVSIAYAHSNRALPRRTFLATSLPTSLLAPASSQAASSTNAREAVRRAAAYIPGYGNTDVFYPKSWQGTWACQRTDAYGENQPGDDKPYKYSMRFLLSIEDDAVVLDRGYAARSREQALTGTAPETVQWTSTNPNDLTTVRQDGVRREIKVTKRASERTGDAVNFSEFQRITIDKIGNVPVIVARRVMQKWKQVDTNTLEALEIVYDMGRGDNPMMEPKVSSKSRMRLTRAAP